MRKLVPILILLLTSCSILNNNLLDIGDSIENNDVKIVSSSHVFSSDLQIRELKLISYNDIYYYVRFTEDNTIFHIIAVDKRFRTPENYKIGDQFSLIQDDTISSRKYGGICVFKLESDWYAIIV